MQLNLQSLYILLVLAIKPSHGYEIMKEAKRYSEGRVQFGPGTLYGAIKRMLDEGLIQEVTLPQAPAAKERRYYELTETGRDRLQSALSQLDTTIQAAKKANILFYTA